MYRSLSTKLVRSEIKFGNNCVVDENVCFILTKPNPELLLGNHVAISRGTIIPVPPSDTGREFQPVIEVAKSIGKKLKIDVCNDCVLKTKKTSFLKNMTMEEKEKILNGIFEVKSNLIKNKKVLLFDDIFQTGSTWKEITKVLYTKGQVENVYVLTVTKTTTKSNN